MRAVVVAHGDVDEPDRAELEGADLIVAADGGSAHLARWGVAPHVVVGDLDSLGSSVGDARIEAWPREKDKSDTELAVERAIAAGADEVVILGALGGARTDHAVANTLLLARAQGRARVSIVYGPLRVRLARTGERLALRGAAGDLVTLLAVGGDASGIRTEGLRYALRGETLVLGSSRGLSNEVVGPRAGVSVGSGMLFVIESSQRALPPASPGSRAAESQPSSAAAEPQARPKP